MVFFILFEWKASFFDIFWEIHSLDSSTAIVDLFVCGMELHQGPRNHAPGEVVWMLKPLLWQSYQNRCPQQIDEEMEGL